MASRSPTTQRKRQREMAKMEKRRQKAEKRAGKKLETPDGEVKFDDQMATVESIVGPLEPIKDWPI